MHVDTNALVHLKLADNALCDTWAKLAVAATKTKTANIFRAASGPTAPERLALLEAASMELALGISQARKAVELVGVTKSNNFAQLGGRLGASGSSTPLARIDTAISEKGLHVREIAWARDQVAELVTGVRNSARDLRVEAHVATAEGIAERVMAEMSDEGRLVADDARSKEAVRGLVQASLGA